MRCAHAGAGCVPLEHGPWQRFQLHSGASLLMEWRRRKSFLFLFWLGQSRPHHHTHGWKFWPECRTGTRLLGLWSWQTALTERKGREEGGIVRGGGHQTQSWVSKACPSLKVITSYRHQIKKAHYNIRIYILQTEWNTSIQILKKMVIKCLIKTIKHFFKKKGFRPTCSSYVYNST